MKKTYNFIGNRQKAYIFSGALFVITLIALIANKGLNWSIDFVGGTSLQLHFAEDITPQMAALKSGINDLGLGTPEVKVLGSTDAASGTDIQIIVKKTDNNIDVADNIKGAIRKALPNNSFDIAQSSIVGPKVGQELQGTAVKAILISFLVIVIYIGIRFRLPYGIAAIVALVHDVTITIGFFALASMVAGWEISLPVIAAILTIVGYSLNDTIVVFDRIRENTHSADKNESFADVINRSVNQTLSRTLITSLTTLVVVVSIFSVFANSGNVLETFTGALIVGIITGTYSSIFIASPVLLMWNRKWPIKS